MIDLAGLHARGWLDADDLVPDPAFEVQRLNFAAVVPWRMDRLRRAAARIASTGDEADRDSYAEFGCGRRMRLASRCSRACTTEAAIRRHDVQGAARDCGLFVN